MVIYIPVRKSSVICHAYCSLGKSYRLSNLMIRVSVEVRCGGCTAGDLGQAFEKLIWCESAVEAKKQLIVLSFKASCFSS